MNVPSRFHSLCSALLALLVIAPMVAPMAQADIQDSISHQEGAFRKLGRGLANVVYGFTELPMTMIAENEQGHIPGTTEGLVVGLKRAVVRLGYGLYEVATFPSPTNDGTYRSPFHARGTIYPYRGYNEYPPELGFFERRPYTRWFPGH